MANQSAKRNEINNRSRIKYLRLSVLILCCWAGLMEAWSILGEGSSWWHSGMLLLVCWLSWVCLKQIIKCWELALPEEASDYYFDVLFMNAVVQIGHIFTHKVWYIYLLIVGFLGWHGSKFLWNYITPTYEQPQPEELQDKKERKRPTDRMQSSRK